MESARELIRCEIEAEAAERDWLRTRDVGALVGMGDWLAEREMVRVEVEAQQLCL